MTSDYCRIRLAPGVPPLNLLQIRAYLVDLIDRQTPPPQRSNGFDWSTIAEKCGLERPMTPSLIAALRPVLELLQREVPKLPQSADKRREPKARRRSIIKDDRATAAAGRPKTKPAAATAIAAAAPDKCGKPGLPPRPVIEFPVAIWDHWDEPDTFSEALALHMKRHGDTCWHLHRAVVREKEVFDRKTLYSWRAGTRVPRSTESLKVLARIERRYRLPAGYFSSKLTCRPRAVTGFRLPGISAAEQRRLVWYLPDDFNDRPLSEREEILDWVRRVIVTGATDYRRFQAAALKTKYGIRFPSLLGDVQSPIAEGIDLEAAREDEASDPDLLYSVVDAPARLYREMMNLVQFKTATLTAAGFQRHGVWGQETAAQKVEHLGLLFGALAAAPKGPVRGCGVPLRQLSFGLLVFPAIWDWYVHWREQRRGFFTAWEVDMLRFSLAISRKETGWLRQNRQLFGDISPVGGLITAGDIDQALSDWDLACDNLHRHITARVKEVQRVARVHRDPFEPILAILEAASPVNEYRKITEEILTRMPDPRRYPVAAAEAVRGFLMLRLGLHTGLRQKNLRQLLICQRGAAPTSERRLTDLKRGELRWSERDDAWEILIPAAAFKNSQSSYFSNKPFRLLLPDLGQLYHYMEAYLTRDRSILLRGAQDPGTFFIKTVKRTSTDAAYDQTTFYEAWRLVIQRYGIYNPYTKRGAIVGLLPHGPHNIRDVVATHILKKTGSYEQASYAIQDTPEMVAKHYGRFLPQDKAALAAQILNRVWDAA